MRKRSQEHPIKYFRESGKSESSAQQAVNREMKPMRGRVQALLKSWQVLSVSLVTQTVQNCTKLYMFSAFVP